MELTVDPGAPRCVSEQIVAGVRLAVASGRARPGERLPSVRSLARTLLVNPNTVARAYRDLTRDGVLATRLGDGVFVAPGAVPVCRRASLAAVREAVRAAVRTGLDAGLSPEAVEDLVRECLSKEGAPCHAGR
ncbi:MAG: GntR family transcriptional regulator [Planctomycetes bacterium]|jgi:GntR family transcriptional regulator|nr:GntR family transcriptional regulator [Planctomycetota bacterium]